MNRFSLCGILFASCLFMTVYGMGKMGGYMPYYMPSYYTGAMMTGGGGMNGSYGGVWSFLVFIIILIIIASIFGIGDRGFYNGGGGGGGENYNGGGGNYNGGGGNYNGGGENYNGGGDIGFSGGRHYKSYRYHKKDWSSSGCAGWDRDCWKRK